MSDFTFLFFFIHSQFISASFFVLVQNFGEQSDQHSNECVHFWTDLFDSRCQLDVLTRISDGSRISQSGTNPKGGDTNLLFGQISWKLHENEEKFTGGGGASKIWLCRSAPNCNEMNRVCFALVVYWLNRIAYEFLLWSTHGIFNVSISLVEKHWNLFVPCSLSYLHSFFLSGQFTNLAFEIKLMNFWNVLLTIA